jgi:hypothetical protein
MNEPAPDEFGKDKIDFAWKVYDQQISWIEKVDFKASLMLPVQIGLLTLLGAVLMSDKRPKLNNILDVSITFGIAFIGTAMVLTTFAVIPRLGKVSEDSDDLIYFGHLRELGAATIRSRISTLGDHAQLGAISRQLEILSKLNWTKHQFLRYGMASTLLGGILCALPVLFSWIFLK